MAKYRILKLIKKTKPFSKDIVFEEEKVYPYRMNNFAHAKTCAIMVGASINYNDVMNNNVVDVIVRDESDNIVFRSRKNIDGIPGKIIDDIYLMDKEEYYGI